MKERFKKIFCYIYPFLWIVCLVLTLVFTLILIVVWMGSIYIELYVVLSVFFFISTIASVVIMTKAENWEWVKETNERIKGERIRKKAEAGKIIRYQTAISAKNLKEELKNLKLFTSAELDGGILFYRAGERKFLRKSEGVHSLFLPDDGFSLNYRPKDAKKYLSDLSERIDSRLKGHEALSCAVLIPEKNIDEVKQGFYFRFKGYRKEEDTYNFCGIDKNTSRLYFYQLTPLDDGTEADLGGLIIRELQATKESDKNA